MEAHAGPFEVPKGVAVTSADRDWLWARCGCSVAARERSRHDKTKGLTIAGLPERLNLAKTVVKSYLGHKIAGHPGYPDVPLPTLSFGPRPLNRQQHQGFNPDSHHSACNEVGPAPGLQQPQQLAHPHWQAPSSWQAWQQQHQSQWHQHAQQQQWQHAPQQQHQWCHKCGYYIASNGWCGCSVASDRASTASSCHRIDIC